MAYQMLEDGSLQIQGKLTILVNGSEIETSDLYISVFKIKKTSSSYKSGGLFQNGDSYRMTNGILSKNGDGSLLITGSDTSPVIIEKMSEISNPNAGLLVEFQGSTALDEIVQEASESTGEVSYSDADGGDNGQTAGGGSTGSNDQTTGSGSTSSNDQTAGDGSTSSNDQTADDGSTSSNDQTADDGSTGSNDQTAGDDSTGSNDQTTGDGSTGSNGHTSADNTNTDESANDGNSFSGFYGDSAWTMQVYDTHETEESIETEPPAEREEPVEPAKPAEPVEPEKPVEIESPPPPKEETVDITWEDGSLCITGKINFHAVDTETGWHPEEYTDELQIRAPWLENRVEEFKKNISEDDRLLQIRGGICTKQEDGSILLIEGENDRPIFTFPSVSDEHTQHEGLCVDYEGTLGPTNITAGGFSAWLYGGTLLLAAILSAIVSGIFITWKRKKKEKTGVTSFGHTEATGLMLGPPQLPTSVSVGQCQHIGRRSVQQDSMGLFKVNGGIFAVVADGMGGLKDGDKVSQKIVKTIGEDCRTLSTDQIRGNLMAIVTHANDEVNRMLGPNDLYKSGSTTVAVLAEQQQFQWVSVGDSRIYLYRGGRLLQLNREHNFEADLLMRAVNHQISFQEAMGNPKRKSVSSFIGMGSLKYVDEMRRPIRTLKGDRIILCSDGIFNTLTEPMIETVLGENPDPSAAAAKLEAAVLRANNPHQDNFTAIIIGYE